MRRGNRHLVGVVHGRPQRRFARRHHAQPARRKSRKGRDQAHRRRDHRAQSGRCQCRCCGSRSRSRGRPRRFRSRARFRSPRARAGRAAAGAFDRTGSRSIFAAAAAAVPPPQAKPEPAPLTNGVIQTQSIAAIPGSSEPMKPVKVKTVQIKAGQVKLASAGSAQPATPDHQCDHRRPARKCRRHRARSWPRPNPTRLNPTADVARTEMPPQPANHGTGNGLLGVLPASSVPPSSASQAMAYADPNSHAQPQAVQQNGAIKPVAAHTGWIIQVGALESESEARAAHRSRAQPGPRPAQQGRSVHRTGRRQGRQEAVPRPLRRPRPRSGRSGVPDAEALRHFLHHRPELISDLSATACAQIARRRNPEGKPSVPIRGRRMPSGIVEAAPAARICVPQTSRQDLAAKLAERKIDHAGQRRAATGRQPERKAEATRGL